MYGVGGQNSEIRFFQQTGQPSLAVIEFVVPNTMASKPIRHNRSENSPKAPISARHVVTCKPSLAPASYTRRAHVGLDASISSMTVMIWYAPTALLESRGQQVADIIHMDYGQRQDLPSLVHMANNKPKTNKTAASSPGYCHQNSSPYRLSLSLKRPLIPCALLILGLNVILLIVETDNADILWYGHAQVLKGSSTPEEVLLLVATTAVTLCLRRASRVAR